MMQLDFIYWLKGVKERLFSRFVGNAALPAGAGDLAVVDERCLAELEGLEEQELPPSPWV